jgi:hypothetical protein
MSDYENGETTWLLVYVSHSVSGGKESHESFFRLLGWTTSSFELALSRELVANPCLQQAFS